MADIDSLKSEIEQLKSSKIENEKSLLEKNAQLNTQIKRMDETVNELKSALKSLEEDLERKQKQNSELINELKDLRDKMEQDDSQQRDSEEKCNRLARQINELNESLSSVQFEKTRCEKELKESLDAVQSKLTAERDELAKLVETNENKYKEEIESVRVELTEKLNEERRVLQERLNNTEIDLNACRDKLSESLKDYKTSIDKLKQASSQRLQKLKKKLANCQTVLGLIEKNLFQSDSTTNTSSLSSTSLFASFVNNLMESKKQGGGDNVSVDEENSANFEFDEARFREIIESKRAEIEKLKSNSNLENEVRQLNETIVQLNQQLDTSKSELIKTETKLNVDSYIYILG